MERIYDSTGNPVAWIHGQFILDEQFENLGHVQSELFFSTKGDCLGQFSDGYFWELSGSAIGYIGGAANGPVLPIGHPKMDYAPNSGMTALSQLPPNPFNRLNIWSQNNWSNYIGNLNV